MSTAGASPPSATGGGPLVVSPPATAGATVATAGGRQRWWMIARETLRTPTGAVGAVILLFWIFDAIAWRVIAPYDPDKVNALLTLQGPSGAHLLGTDDLGRDVLSRVLAGASTVFEIAPAGTALGLLGGITFGLVSGYFRGWVDDVLMRIVDALLAFPLIIIAVLVLAVLGGSVVNVIFVIGVVFTPLVARTVRSTVLVEREREYVAAAKLRGARAGTIMVREILPNITGPLIVEATVRLGYAIFTSATLSFLSLGVQPPSPDWGLSIASGRGYLQVAPWVVLGPAVALATLVVSVNLVTDALKRVVEE